ncbi:MAG TPA: MerR family transcriptional regulator [Streptosporangiaceae bacterium]|nr:MerR family transcriptional regulator [Streptosporangiaceae bacterium]
MSGLRSGQLARAVGVNQQTLRYYERRGLLAAPHRTAGGHRLYPPETVTVLRLIKAAQRLGFSLREVADVLEVGTGTGTGLAPGCSTWRRRSWPRSRPRSRSSA